MDRNSNESALHLLDSIFVTLNSIIKHLEMNMPPIGNLGEFRQIFIHLVLKYCFTAHMIHF